MKTFFLLIMAVLISVGAAWAVKQLISPPTGLRLVTNNTATNQRKLPTYFSGGEKYSSGHGYYLNKKEQ